MKSKPIEQQARELISGPRRAEYGDVSVSAARLAKLWSAYLGILVTPKDAMIMMSLFKISREKGAPKIDNRIDGVAYMLLADILEMKD